MKVTSKSATPTPSLRTYVPIVPDRFLDARDPLPPPLTDAIIVATITSGPALLESIVVIARRNVRAV